MPAETVPYGRKTQRPSPVAEVHILWITAGLGLRRRFGLHHRRHAAEHRRCRAGRHSGPPEGAPAQSRSRLRERRRLPEVLVSGRAGQAGAVRSGGGRLHPQRKDQEGRLLGRARNRRQYRPADHDHASGSTGLRRRLWPSSARAHARPTAASTRWKAIPPAAWGWPITWAGIGDRRPACRSSTCPAARCSRTTSWRPCCTCSTRWPAWLP